MFNVTVAYEQIKELQEDKMTKAENNVINSLDNSIANCQAILKKNCKEIETILKDDYKKLAIMNQKHNLVRSQSRKAMYTKNKKHDRYLQAKFKKLEQRSLGDIKKYDKSGFSKMEKASKLFPLTTTLC